MMFPWLFGGFLAALVFGKPVKRWLDGEGPFDGQPSGTDSKVIDVQRSVTSDGKRWYEVTSFRRADQIYFVAVRDGGSSKDWVSYLFNPQTKVRFLYRANAATIEGIDTLKKDFSL